MKTYQVETKTMFICDLCGNESPALRLVSGEDLDTGCMVCQSCRAAYLALHPSAK